MPALPRTKRTYPKPITEVSIPLLLISAVSLLAVSANAQSTDITFLSGDRDLSIVAHEDDDLLFLSLDLPKRIQAGDSVRTIFLTAGDAGLGRQLPTSSASIGAAECQRFWLVARRAKVSIPTFLPWSA